VTLHKSQRKDLQENFRVGQERRHFTVIGSGFAVVLAFRWEWLAVICRGLSLYWTDGPRNVSILFYEGGETAFGLDVAVSRGFQDGP
jgi:hypothetical protein